MHRLKKIAVIYKNLKLLAVVICVEEPSGSGFLLELNRSGVGLPMISVYGWGKLWMQKNLVSGAVGAIARSGQSSQVAVQGTCLRDCPLPNSKSKI
jgi:hypothetical protein